MPVGWALGMLANIVVSGIVLAVLPEPNAYAKGVIWVFLAVTTLRLWQLWQYPTVVELREGRLRWRILGRWSSTPRENLSGLELHGRRLVLQFVNGRAVVGRAGRLSRFSSLTRAGFHAALPMGDLTFDETNAIRAALGWPPQPADERGRELSTFIRQLRKRSGALWVTPTLILLNVAAFLGLWWLDFRSGGSSVFGLESGLPPGLLIDWGANYGPRTADGEWWRLLTSVFLHGNLLHIGFNMWGLLIVGRLGERFFGRAAYLTIYLFAGICGGLASVWWNPPVAGVGASGAIFGLFGALLGLVVRQRKRLPPEIFWMIGSQSLAFLVLNLLFGAQIKVVDSAAHVGGALGGLLCGFAAPPVIPAAESRFRLLRPLGLVATCTVLAAIGIATLPPPLAFDIRMTLLRIIDVQRDVERSVVGAEDRSGDGTDAKDLLESLDEALKQLTILRQQIAEAPRIALEDQVAMERLRELLRLQQESWEHLTEALAHDDDLVEQSQAILLDQQAQAALRDLIESEGGRLGFEILPEKTIPEPVED